MRKRGERGGSRERAEHAHSVCTCGGTSDRWFVFSARVPEAENLDLSRLIADAVVEMVANAAQVNAAHALQGSVASACADLGLERNESGPSFKFLANRIGGFWPIDAPPCVGDSDLRSRRVADLNVKRRRHSRARSSSRS